MSSPNGQQQFQEPVSYEDILNYWQGVVIDLHSRLSYLTGQIKNREKRIAELEEALGTKSVPLPGA